MRTVVGLLLAALLPISPAAAEEAVEANCELHIWPTGTISAVDKDNHVMSVPTGLAIGSSYTVVEPLARSIAVAMGPKRQLELMQDFPIADVAPLANYSLVFHEDETSPRDYARQWLDKDFAEGERLSDSKSQCYAELLVVFVTYVDQPLKDTLHTIFVLRHFGAREATIAAAVDGGYHKASNIVWDGSDQDEQAKAALDASFTANLTKFFKRRKIKRLLKEMGS